MSAQKLTSERVSAAANAIQAKGDRPTKRLVRDEVGPIGSDSTLCKYLNAWRKIHEPQSVAPEPATRLPALQRVLLDFMAKELADARAPLAADLAEQQTTAADLIDEGERKNEIIADKDLQLAQLAAAKAVAEGTSAQLAADLAEAHGDVVRQRQAADDLRIKLVETSLRAETLPRLEADLKELRAELATAHQASREVEKRAGVLGAEKAALECRLDDARREAERLHDELKSARDEAARERQASEIARAEMAQAEQRAAVLGAEKAALEGRLVDAKQDTDRLREQLAVAQAGAEKLADLLTDARLKIQASDTRIEGLIAQIEARRAAKAANGETTVRRGKMAKKPTQAAPGERDGNET